VLARIRRGERVDHFETVRRTKDGRLIDMSITVSPIKDAAGHIVGASKVARDITERRRIEDLRTLLLAREQEARRQAEALNNAKDELLATVSHELRTPLNSIFGWARMLQSGQLDEAARARAINTILRNASANNADPITRDAARRRLGVISDVLHTLGTQQFGKRQTDPKPLAPAERYRQMLGLPLGRRLSGVEIHQAYKRVAKRVHPDAGGNAREFQELSAARDALMKER